MSPETFPPARSALNLRLLLACFGAVLCTLLGLLALSAFGVAGAVVLFVLGAVAVVDVLVLLRRRSQRAVQHRGADHRHDSLFE